MFSSTLCRVILAILLTTASASPGASIRKRQTPAIPPTEDPFYVAPDGFESTAPGTILRYRPPPAPLSAFGTIPLNLKGSYQLLYRTNDALGNPQATVTTVLVPNNANTSRLVSYQDFEDASFLNCATSYSIQQGTPNTTLSQLDFIVEGGMLANGWIVSMPDYEGPEAAFLSGMQAGQATLDGLRAVLSSQAITGIAAKEDVDVQMWGYSGGSIPTEWAAELAPTYAPELVIKGAVVGGTVTNLTSSIYTISGGTFAGFGVPGILGLIKSYPNFGDFVDSEVLPEKAEQFYAPLRQCASADVGEFENQDLGTYFRDGLPTISYPEVQAVVQAGGQMGLHGLPQIPMYFYKSIGDEISPVADNNKLVEQYCNQGIESLVYIRNTFGEHISQAFLGGGGAIGYLSDRFNGVTPHKGCMTQDVIIAKPDFSNLGGYGAEMMSLIQELFSLPVGPASL